MEPGRWIARIAASGVIVATASSCARAAPVSVGVVFGNNWVLGPVSLTSDEQRRIKDAAFATMQRAFSGFAVDFVDDARADRIIRLNRQLFGAGATRIGSRMSDVNLDAVYLTLLAVTGCHDLASCDDFERAALVDALGRGIGATAAHELGHQAGFMFTREVELRRLLRRRDSERNTCTSSARNTGPLRPPLP